MSDTGNENINNDLEDVGARLKKLNARVRSLASGRLGETKAPQQSIDNAKNMSVDQMREKLRTINQYLRRKLADGTVIEIHKEEPTPQAAPPVEPPKMIYPEPMLKKAVSKSVVSENVESPIVPDNSEPPTAHPQEKTTSVALPSTGSPSSEGSSKERRGVGLDVGTAYLVASREIEGHKVFVKTERNAFLSVRTDQSTQDFLKELRIKYVNLGGNMFVLGNLAHKFANILNSEVQRTMSMGILNPSEGESISIIKLIVQNILWEPRDKGEICCFSVPANPVDRNQDTIYHRSVFEGILKTLGFEPVVIDEGYAVVLSELEYKNFTGIGVSCGGGMVNVCAAYRSVPLISFSMTRGGDWIDKSTAKVLNMPVSQVTTIKEQGMNLKSPKSREEEALAIYYRNYIRYFLENMAQVFTKSEETPQFSEPVDIVFAGGSSLVGGFLDMVKEELKNVQLGLKVNEIKISEDPFTSVARGCLFQAINIQEAKV